jgi:flavodoxin
VVYGDPKNSTVCRELAGSLAQGIGLQGHDVDVVNADTDAGKIISYYDYIAVGTTSLSWWKSALPSKVETFLRQCGTISGKRSFAFIVKRGIRQGKTLQLLMKVMEGQGMYLTFSDTLANPAYAKEVGKRLVIS